MAFYTDGSWTYRSGDQPTLERWDGGEWLATRMTLEAMDAAAIGGEIWAEINPGAVDLRVEKHFGPGPHPGTGTSQDVHGSGQRASELGSFIDQMVEMQGDHSTLKFPGDYALVKEYGREWKPPRNIVSNELLMAEHDVQSGFLKDCFMNSGRCVLLDSVDLTYVEGFAISGGGIPLPVHHAWLVTDSGQVIDPTWGQTAAQISEEYQGTDLDVLTDVTPGVAYFGIPFTQKSLQDSALENEVWGMLGFHNKGFWEDGIPEEYIEPVGSEEVSKHPGPGGSPIHGTGTTQAVHAGLVNALKGRRQVKGVKVPSFLVHADGTPMSMRLDGLPPKIQEKIFKSAAEAYNLSTDMDLIKARYETILAAALERYKKNPDLRDDDRFYERWFEIWEQEGKGRFPLENVVAAAGAVSPGLEAEFSAEERARGREDNVTMIRRMMDLVDNNPELNVFQAAVVNDMVGALHSRYSEKGRAVADFYDFEVKANTRFNDLPNGYVQAQALHMLMTAEDGTGVPAQRGWRNWALGFDVLTGKSDPSDVLGSAKVRSFYNNIMDPTDTQGRGDVTVDFHMIDSAFWGKDSDDISGPANSPAYQGVQLGIRPMIGQAVHQLLPEWGAKVGAESPAQLQEVIWAEWKRGKEEDAWGDLGTLERK